MCISSNCCKSYLAPHSVQPSLSRGEWFTHSSLGEDHAGFIFQLWDSLVQHLGKPSGENISLAEKKNISQAFQKQV